MLRAHIEAADMIGDQTRLLLRSGKLVSDDLVNQLVEQRIEGEDCRLGIILDGYPRTVNQAAALLDITAEHGFRPVVIHLVVDRDRIVARLSGRRQCPVCGTLYNLTTHPPKLAGICDLDGAALVTREDDREPVIRERLDQYEQQTRSLLNFFREAGVPVFEIDGSGTSPEHIMQQICQSLTSGGFIGSSAGVHQAAAPAPPVVQ